MIAKNKEKDNSIKTSEMYSTVSAHENSPYYSFTPRLNTPHKTPAKTLAHTLTYQYVKNGMQQTLLITSILLGAALILFFLTQLKIIQLSIFGY